MWAKLRCYFFNHDWAKSHMTKFGVVLAFRMKCKNCPREKWIYEWH